MALQGVKCIRIMCSTPKTHNTHSRISCSLRLQLIRSFSGSNTRNLLNKLSHRWRYQTQNHPHCLHYSRTQKRELKNFKSHITPKPHKTHYRISCSLRSQLICSISRISCSLRLQLICLILGQKRVIYKINFFHR